MIVDAHQHFWDPARATYPWMTGEAAALCRAFGPDDLAPLLAASGVGGTVVVQARASLEETRWLLELAAATPFVLGVVGWVDLTGDVPAQLGSFDGALVGVRHQVHDEADPRWLLRDGVQRGIAAVGDAGLVFDLLVRTRELPAAIETVKCHPNVRFVLDHVAKRPRDTAELEPWARGVAELSDRPNVACKLSGLLTEAEPATTVESALRWFGAERCMFGSDWPVSTLAAPYADTMHLVQSRLGEGDRAAVMAGTALRTYGLAVA